MYFTELTEEEFEKHAQSSALANYLQTPQMKRLREKRGWQAIYVGLKDQQTVVASALLSSIPIRFGRFFDIDGGFLADFTNEEVLHQFTEGLHDYIKKNKGVYLTIRPKIVYQRRDSDGKVLEKPNDALLKLLTNLGYQYEGFKVGFANETPRFIFIKDLSDLTKATLRTSYQKDAIYSVKKTIQFGVDVRELSYDELPDFKRLTQHTAMRRGFCDKPLEYYQAVYQTFGQKAKFMVAEINFQTYIDNLYKRAEELRTRLTKIAEYLKNQPNSKKMLNQQREFSNQLQTYEERIKEAEIFLQKVGTGDVLLAGALFIIGQREVIYLFSGTYEQYKNFYAPFLIQDVMLNFAVKHNIPRYNFYGIDGTFDGQDGILKFKQSFSGFIEEEIGAFNLVIRPVKYKMYMFFRYILDKLKS
ncbi:MAG: aminoacyltransferase [Streptococcaceae bacterium]|jgi:alanine adding enzyme|nr:aminoacyltransferase [Streptococcaceae bacterium]